MSTKWPRIKWWPRNLTVRFRLPAEPSNLPVLTVTLTVLLCSACPNLWKFPLFELTAHLILSRCTVIYFNWGFPEPSITYLHVITYHCLYACKKFPTSFTLLSDISTILLPQRRARNIVTVTDKYCWININVDLMK